MMMSKKRYPMIDICRLFCAGLVVFIHVFEIRDGRLLPHLIDACFTKQAVPFFFVVSGYFFGKKIYREKDKIKISLEQAKSMFLLYVAWQILWLPSTISMYVAKYPDASVKYMILLLFRRLFIAGNGAYWYLLVLGEAVLVCGLLIKWKRERIMYVIAIVGGILGLMYESEIGIGIIGGVNTFFYTIFGWSCNALMKGIPFVAVGIFLSQKENLFFSKRQLHWCYFIVNIGCIVYYFVFKNPNSVLLYPIQTIVLFLISVQPSVVISQRISNISRELSSTIYFIHSLYIYYFLDIVWPIDANLVFRWAMTVLLSIITYIILKKMNIRSINWLFSIAK